MGSANSYPGRHLTIRRCSHLFARVQISQSNQSAVVFWRSSVFARDAPQPANLLVFLMVSERFPGARYHHVSDGPCHPKCQIFGEAAEAERRGNLYLLLTPAGGELWRFNYRFMGKQKTLSLGAYCRILRSALCSATAVMALSSLVGAARYCFP